MIALFVGERDAPDVRGGLAPVSWTPDSEPLLRFAGRSLRWGDRRSAPPSTAIGRPANLEGERVDFVGEGLGPDDNDAVPFELPDHVRDRAVAESPTFPDRLSGLLGCWCDDDKFPTPTHLEGRDGPARASRCRRGPGPSLRPQAAVTRGDIGSEGGLPGEPPSLPCAGGPSRDGLWDEVRAIAGRRRRSGGASGPPVSARSTPEEGDGPGQEPRVVRYVEVGA